MCQIALCPSDTRRPFRSAMISRNLLSSGRLLSRAEFGIRTATWACAWRPIAVSRGARCGDPFSPPGRCEPVLSHRAPPIPYIYEGNTQHEGNTQPSGPGADRDRHLARSAAGRSAREIRVRLGSAPRGHRRRASTESRLTADRGQLNPHRSKKERPARGIAPGVAASK